MSIWGFDNDAQSVALAPITASQLTLPIQSSSAFAALTDGLHQSVVRIDDTGVGGTPGKYEFVLCNGNTTGTNTLIVSSRGYAGTTATSFMPGATLTEVMTAEVFEGAFARIDTSTEFAAAVTMDDTLAVTGDTTLSSTLEVAGVATFSGGTTHSDVVTTESGFGDFTASGRFLGSMANVGAPASTSVTYLTGDWGYDSRGNRWVCTAGGSPGTWYCSEGVVYNQVLSTAVAANTAWNIPFGAVIADEMTIDIQGCTSTSTASFCTYTFNNDTGGNYSFNLFYSGAGSANTWTNFQSESTTSFRAEGVFAPASFDSNISLRIPTPGIMTGSSTSRRTVYVFTVGQTGALATASSNQMSLGSVSYAINSTIASLQVKSGQGIAAGSYVAVKAKGWTNVSLF